MNEFDTPDKDNVYENEEEMVDSEVIDEQEPEDIPDEEIQETEDAEEYNDDESEYEYDEEEVIEQEQDAQEDDDKSKGVLSAIRYYIASKIYAFSQLDKRKRRNRIVAFIAIVLLAVLIMTDIIPLLPNSYHRSYVGNQYTLGETRGSTATQYGKGVLYASPHSVMCFGPDMELISKVDTFPGTPLVRTNGDGAVIYTRNGNNALVMSSAKEYQLVDSKEEIISASVNDDGDYILVTKEAGYTACVSAYTSSMQLLYKWHTGNNVLDTALSPDSTDIVASVIEHSDTDVYSKLIFMNTGSKTPVKEVVLESNIAVELVFVDSGTVIAFGDSFTSAYTPNGNLKWQIDYEGKDLRTYDLSDDGNIAFLFSRYTSGLSQSRLELYNNRGRRTGAYDSAENVRAISVNNDYCLLALEDKTILTDNDGDVRKVKKHSATYSKLVLFQNYNFAFGINDSVAEIVSVKH